MLTTDNFEDALEAAGSFGRAQLMMLALVCYITAYNGWQAFAAIFATLETKFYCLSSKTLNETHSYDGICEESCTQYIYDPSVTSIVSQFDLACGDKHYLASLSNSAFWVSYFFSCLISGCVSDRFGRKLISLIELVVLGSATFLTAFSPNIYIYIALRAIAGFCSLNFTLDLVILAESVDKKYLSIFGVTGIAIFGLGGVFAAISGYVFRASWQLQFVVMSLPTVLYFFLHFFLMPESARWLHSKQRFNEAEKALKWIAKLNGKETSPVFLSLSSSSDDKILFTAKTAIDENPKLDIPQITMNEPNTSAPQLKLSLFSLFGTFRASILTLTSALSWFAASFVYYGLTYNVQNIGGDVYVNSLLLTITEFPSWLVFSAMNKYGRKNSLALCLVVSSFACAVLPFSTSLFDGKVQIICAMIAKMVSCAAFILLFVYSPEQFPTVLRSTGLTLCSSAARVASILAPFVIQLELGPQNCAPFFIFGFSGLIATGLVLMFGVETLNRPFITTVEEYYLMARRGEIKSNSEVEGDQI